eukprot:s1306_g6.t1
MVFAFCFQTFAWSGAYFMHEPGMKNMGVIADEEECELAWARKRPTSMAGHFDENPALAPGKWECALNDMEYKFLDSYRRAWPGAAFQLNQCPTSGHGHHSSSEHRLFTLISNLGLIWSDHVGRWMLPTETLICQHFPVLPYFHRKEDELTVFHIKNDARHGRRVGAQVGNSMHVGIMSLLQLHSLCEIKRATVPDLFVNIKLARTSVGAPVRESTKHITFFGI